MIPRPPRAWRRGAFWLYALALFTATHWPNVRIEGPIPRPDIVIHIAAFGLWTLLLIVWAPFGPSFSRRNILACGAIGVAYSALDEITQAVPILGRTAAFDDFLANVGGVASACVGAAIRGIRGAEAGRAEPEAESRG